MNVDDNGSCHHGCYQAITDHLEQGNHVNDHPGDDALNFSAAWYSRQPAIVYQMLVREVVSITWSCILVASTNVGTIPYRLQWTGV